MNQAVDGIGTALGTVGVLVCVLAVVLRFAGSYYLLGTELRMWLLGGIALLAMGCFAKLHAMTTRG